MIQLGNKLCQLLRLLLRLRLRLRRRLLLLLLLLLRRRRRRQPCLRGVVGLAKLWLGLGLPLGWQNSG